MEELLLEMLRHYGLKEISGIKHNGEIVNFFKDIGYNINDDETAWCSAAINYFCKKLGYERSGKLDARSWLTVGQEVKAPEIGDVIVLWRDDPKSWKGHVGLFISRDNGMVYVLGGNQNNMLNISLYLESRVLGYRRLSKL